MTITKDEEINAKMKKNGLVTPTQGLAPLSVNSRNNAKIIYRVSMMLQLVID